MTTTTHTRVFTPRPYQVESEAAFYAAWNSGLRRCVVSLATGMGKTVVFTNMIKREVAAGHRVIVLVNARELLTQTADTIAEIIPNATVGIVQGPRQQTDVDVIVAMVQTLGRNILRAEAIGPVDLIVIDECHHAAAVSYIDTVRELGGFDGVRVAGFTASAARSDGLGLGDMWQKVVYSRDVNYAFAHDYLIRPDVLPLFRSSPLGSPNLDPDYLAWTWQRYAGRQLGMVITSTVEKAWAIHAAFLRAGIPAEVVEGDIPNHVRKEIYRRTRTGENRVLISVSCLREGFDMPELTVLMMACGVGSQVVWSQSAGRIMRLAPWVGKTRASIFDMTGASTKWSSPTDPYGFVVRADLSPTMPGKRPTAALKPVPVADNITNVSYIVRHTWGRKFIFRGDISLVLRVTTSPHPTRRGKVQRHETVLATLRTGSRADREAQGQRIMRADQVRASGLHAAPWEPEQPTPGLTRRVIGALRSR